jgi:hypothetical protein
VPAALKELLYRMGWTQGNDGEGALVWYPPSASPSAKTAHYDDIMRGIERSVEIKWAMRKTIRRKRRTFQRRCSKF